MCKSLTKKKICFPQYTMTKKQNFGMNNFYNHKVGFSFLTLYENKLENDITKHI